MPQKATAHPIASGMLRRGLFVSSPSAAAPSKPPKESSPNTDAKDRTDPDACCRNERLQREALPVGCGAADHLPEDDDDQDHDQRHGDPFEGQQCAGGDFTSP